MTLTDSQIQELKEAAMPLMKWLEYNCHPHVTAIVDSERAEVGEGLVNAFRRSHYHIAGLRGISFSLKAPQSSASLPEDELLSSRCAEASQFASDVALALEEQRKSILGS